MEEKKIAMRASGVTLASNVFLAIFKFISGYISKSGAIMTDAIQSLGDVLSSIIGIVGINMSNKEADEDHQYGHEKIESVVAMILAVLLFITGIGIGTEGIKKILSGENISAPGVLALVAAAVTVIYKELLYRYTKVQADKINSSALQAFAWDHRSDALSGIGIFIGVLGARMGFPILDSVASVVICIFIVKAAIEIFKDSIDRLVDKSCDPETVEEMRKTIEVIDGVIQIDDLRTRLFGNKMYVDVEFSADGTLSLNEAHDIAIVVHNTIEREFPLVKHCMVHVNPYEVK